MNKDNALLDTRYYTKANTYIRDMIDDFDKITQVKMMCALISKLKQDCYTDKDCLVTEITLDSLISYMNNSANQHKTKKNYFETICEFQSVAFYRMRADGYISRFPMFEQIDIPEELGQNKYSTDKPIKFYWKKAYKELVTTDKEFAKCLLRATLELKSPKAIKFYEYLTSVVGFQTVTYDIPKIREILELNTPYYDNTKYTTKALKGIISDINEHTNLQIHLKQNYNPKDKRRTDSFTFIIKDKSKKSVWFDNAPLVKLTAEEYKSLSDLGDPNIKFYARQLNDLLEEGKPIRNHYAQIIKFQKAGRCDLRSKEERKVRQPVCKSNNGRLSRKPTYDIEKIKEYAKNNTEII